MVFFALAGLPDRIPTARLALSQGDTLEIAGQFYRVREVRQIRDGSESVATLSRL